MHPTDQKGTGQAMRSDLLVPRAGRRVRLRRATRRAALATTGLMTLYFAIVLVGLVPVNNSFRPTADGIEIMVSSTAVHADIWMPVATRAIDWREEFPADCFRGSTAGATHMVVGWGDRGFYLKARFWSDLRASTVAKALLWPSDTCLHVSLRRPGRDADELHRLSLSEGQYGVLVAAIRDSFQRDPAGSAMQLRGFAYSGDDAFFAAKGRYHALQTCNSWVGKCLQRSGVRTPWLTPLPKSVFLYWPTPTPSPPS